MILDFFLNLDYFLKSKNKKLILKYLQYKQEKKLKQVKVIQEIWQQNKYNPKLIALKFLKLMDFLKKQHKFSKKTKHIKKFLTKTILGHKKKNSPFVQKFSFNR